MASINYSDIYTPLHSFSIISSHSYSGYHIRFKPNCRDVIVTIIITIGRTSKDKDISVVQQDYIR
jgi:hypothetical protein